MGFFFENPSLLLNVFPYPSYMHSLLGAITHGGFGVNFTS
jgi:hypothetical protein